jgi:hypothetical protein
VSLESRLAVAANNAHLYICMVQTDMPTYRPGWARRIERELASVLEEAEEANLLPKEEADGT